MYIVRLQVRQISDERERDIEIERETEKESERRET